MAKKEDSIKCTSCGEPKDIKDFYMSASVIHKSTKRITICKDCIFLVYEGYLKRYGTYKKAMYKLCQLLDVPFNSNAYVGAEKEGFKKEEPIYKYYIGKINSFRDKNGYGNCFEDSDKFEDDESEKNIVNKNPSTMLSEKWGDNYNPTQITKMEKFYKDMCDTHNIVTPQHKQLLSFMCKLNLKMDDCLENEDLSNFAKLNEQYQKIMQSAGFRPIDKTSSDNSYGIKTFSQIFESVEKDGFIKPASIQENQDIVDRTIMYMLNYTRKLVGVQKLESPPIDTPKVDVNKVVEIDEISVDFTKELEEVGEISNE